MLSDALLFLLAPGIGKGKGAEKTAEEGEMKDAKSARSKKARFSTGLSEPVSPAQTTEKKPDLIALILKTLDIQHYFVLHKMHVA